MCFIYFGVKKGNGEERREKKEEGRKKEERGRGKEEGAIVWEQWRSADRTMNLWGWLGGAIDRLNLYPEEENRINPRILSDKRLTNYTISSIIKIRVCVKTCRVD
jgi:hypothetical protein